MFYIHDEVTLHFKILSTIYVGLESYKASMKENLLSSLKQFEINCF
jgi:hypothetical protein